MDVSHDEGTLPAPYNRLARTHAALRIAWIGSPTTFAVTTKPPRAPLHVTPRRETSVAVSIEIRLRSAPGVITHFCHLPLSLPGKDASNTSQR